jgi:hypothetical protein
MMVMRLMAMLAVMTVVLRFFLMMVVWNKIMGKRCPISQKGNGQKDALE